MIPIDNGKRLGTVFSILSDAAMKQPSTQISSNRAYHFRTGRSWPAKWAFWQTETGTAAAPLHRASAKSVLQFRIDEGVRDGLARISGVLRARALARVDSAGKNRADDLQQARVTIERSRALLRLARPV